MDFCQIFVLKCCRKGSILSEVKPIRFDKTRQFEVLKILNLKKSRNMSPLRAERSHGDQIKFESIRDVCITYIHKEC